MKTIRLQLTEELHTRLKSLCKHWGHQAHLLRRGVRLVCEEEEQKLSALQSRKDTNATDTTSVPNTTT